MDATQFRKMFYVLHNLSKWDLEVAGIISTDAKGGSDWTRFNNDLTTFVLKLPKDRQEKLVELLKRETSGWLPA